MKSILLFFCFVVSANVTAQLDSLSVRKQLDSLLIASTIAFNKNEYAQSQRINQQILSIADSINDHDALHQVYRYLAYDLLITKDTAQARQALEKSMTYAKNSTHEENVADTYLLMASLLENSKQPFKEVLNSYNTAIEIYKRKQDSVGLGIAYLNFIETCFLYEEYDEAYLYLEKNESIIEKHLPEDIYFYNIQLANYYVEIKNYEKAEYHINYAENHESYHENPTDKTQIYDLKSSIYHGKGEFKKAYDALVIAKQSFEKKQNEIHTGEIQKVAATFEVEQYKKNAVTNQQNIKLQNELLASKNKINTFLILLSTLSLLVILFLVYIYFNRKKLIDKLKIKNNEYLEAKEESERLATSKSEFFNTVSHELRTPLYGVIGMSTLLLEDPDIPAKNSDNLKTLKFSADYLLALVNDVLQLGKIDAKKIPLESSLINIEALINSLLATFEYSKNQNKNTFHVDIATDVPRYFKGNSMILKQVLMNLVGNATKFTENGTITIDVTTINHNEIEFSIIDDGPGIPISKQKEIFSEFTQLKNSNSYYGTGLGLPIVAKLLHLLDSQIELVSEIDSGSTFSFKFPIEEADVSETIAPLTTHILDDKTFDGKKILVVDDNTINQIVTSKILSKLKANCTIASDGREAVNTVKEQDFDLILMDINMPVLDGFDATKEIRTLGYELPIIALTAVEADDVRLKSVESGMNGFIIKPYDIADFKRTIAINLIQFNKSNAFAKAQ